MKNIKYIALLVMGTLLWQCEPNVDEFEPSAGEADFTTFVSIGDSYSAGYTDGALSYDGQLNSFPNIIAKQLKTVGMVGEFNQPLIPQTFNGNDSVSIGNTPTGGMYILIHVTKYKDPKTDVWRDTSYITPNSIVGYPELLSNPTNWVNSPTLPYRNVGVPGAKSIHLMSSLFGNYTLGSGNFNPYYARFASNPGTSTVFGDGMAAQPTFVSLWIGGNDVLAYALAGGEGAVGGNGTNDITAESTFGHVISTMFSTLKNADIKGVTGNIPDVNSLPYFTTVPYNSLVLTEKQASDLNKLHPTLNFVKGANGFAVEDKSGSVRHAVASDRILLSALSGIKTKDWGSATVLGKQYVLDATELSAINTATIAFNAILKAKAEEFGLAFADLNKLMTDIVVGKMIDGVAFSSAFVKGNTFSLDGIHATPRGSAVIANEFIKAINAKYNASVPLVNINDYRSNVFPE